MGHLSPSVLFFSGQADSEATSTTEERRPSYRRTDAVDRRRPVDQSPSQPAPGISSLQRRRVQQQQPSSPHQRVAGDAGAIVHDDEDVFVVGPPGGLFQSSTDPVVAIYIPPSAVAHTITLTMQVTHRYDLQPEACETGELGKELWLEVATPTPRPTALWAS